MIELHHDGLSRPLDAPSLRVLSLGAGVQSTWLALAAERGDLGFKPDCAIFADTKSEPSAVYRHLEWLTAQLSFPVHIVSKGSLREEIFAAARGERGAWGRPPLFVRNRSTGKVGMTKRQCTQDYKLEPITAKVRDLMGLKKGQSIRHFLRLKRAEPVPYLVEQWIGISTDEIVRVKPSRHAYIWNRHVIIEARLARRDILTWYEERQYPIPPKSACTFCPYHTNEMWRDMRANDPESWADAVAVDEALRADSRHRGLKGELFLHRQCVPLAQANLDGADVAGFDFSAECEGMCGV